MPMIAARSGRPGFDCVVGIVVLFLAVVDAGQAGACGE
jgi:hypothetical protein